MTTAGTVPAALRSVEHGAADIATRRQRVAELQHLSQLEIALELGVAPTTVARDERALGLNGRERGRPAGSPNGSGAKRELREQRAALRAELEAQRDARVGRVAARYQADPTASLAVLAQEEGVSDQQIWRDLRRVGVTLHPPGRRNRFAGTREQRRERARTLYAEYRSTPKVADELGVSQFCVWSDLAPLGVLRPPPGRRLTPDERRVVAHAAVRRYRDGKLTLEQVGAELDRSDTTILRYLAELGIDRREAAHLLDGLRAKEAAWHATYVRTGSTKHYGRNAKEIAAARGKRPGPKGLTTDEAKLACRMYYDEQESERKIAQVLTDKRRDRGDKNWLVGRSKVRSAVRSDVRGKLVQNPPH
jgi:hypothetical protein